MTLHGGMRGGVGTRRSRLALALRYRQHQHASVDSAVHWHAQAEASPWGETRSRFSSPAVMEAAALHKYPLESMSEIYRYVATSPMATRHSSAYTPELAKRSDLSRHTPATPIGDDASPSSDGSLSARRPRSQRRW
jgi:hypothetical protein